MKASNVIKPAVTVLAFASVIGLAYAQTGTGSPSQPNTTPPAANTDTAPMNNPSTKDSTRAPAATNDNSTRSNMSGQSTNNPSSTNERVARADRG